MSALLRRLRRRMPARIRATVGRVADHFRSGPRNRNPAPGGSGRPANARLATSSLVEVDREIDQRPVAPVLVVAVGVVVGGCGGCFDVEGPAVTLNELVAEADHARSAPRIGRVVLDHLGDAETALEEEALAGEDLQGDEIGRLRGGGVAAVNER